MIKFKNLFFLILLIGCFGCAKKLTNQIVDNRLNNLLESKNYFKLKDELAKSENELNEDRVLYYDAFINRAFGQAEKSNIDIDVLFQYHSKSLSDTEIVKLLDIKAANHLYLYHYKQVAAIYGEILSKYSIILDSTDVANYKNIKNLFTSFANIKTQKIHKQKDVLLHAYRNKFNHLLTRVKMGTKNEEFIFDTGANLSTISASEAKEMKLTVFDQIVDIGSSTQKIIQSTLAVADSLYIGDILFENVLFIVMPDDELTFSQINYSIKGIIGFPVIHQLGEVHLNKDGEIFIPKVASEKTGQNMFFENFDPVVKATSDNDTLLLIFDTGAGHTELSFKYFSEHRNEIEKKGNLQISERGGAGGKAMVKEYLLYNFPLKIGTQKTSIEKMPVILEEYRYNKFFDGNLGQDVFLKFNCLIISFDHMFIDFK